MLASPVQLRGSAKIRTLGAHKRHWDSGPFSPRARGHDHIGRASALRDLDHAPEVAAIRAREAKRAAKFAASSWRWYAPLFTSKLAQRQLRLAAGLLRALAGRGHIGAVREVRDRSDLVDLGRQVLVLPTVHQAGQRTL